MLSADKTSRHSMKGTFYDIKEFTLHDGPGVRTTVFLKGCPLRCKWCHNPEGLSGNVELLVNNLCNNCGACLKGCQHPECQPFARCTRACSRSALQISGTQADAAQLAETLKRQSQLLVDGGITISGGEPLMQSAFTVELLKALSPLHTALQTCGYANKDVFAKVIDACSLVLFDVKIFNTQQHIRWTGVDNKIIIENLFALDNSGKQYIVRVPLIPGITDTAENLCDIAQLSSSLKNMQRVELMPYNPFAGAKYRWLSKEYELSYINRPSDLGAVVELFDRYKVPFKILL